MPTLCITEKLEWINKTTLLGGSCLMFLRDEHSVLHVSVLIFWPFTLITNFFKKILTFIQMYGTSFNIQGKTFEWVKYL